MAHEGIGSPSLDQPLRSKERAALDIAVRALRAIKRRPGALVSIVDDAGIALRSIADLVPEAVPQPNPGAQQ